MTRLRARFVLALLPLLLLLVSACKSTGEDSSMCLKRKPGTIVTANQYCAIVLADPVDPTVVLEWKGQKVGLCCQGCIPKWEKLTEAEKDAALATAIAKGPIRD
ncbi:MAG: hypothetical protein IT453_00320 [Planctomycetes bacterium]|nr:hypothetical protein [Planctomycetota bacterium]